MADSISLSEICITAASKAWKDDGELLATGIGLIPRIAAGLAKLTCNPDLMMTDGETFLISKPLPMGKRDASEDLIEGYMSYSRVFENLWGGQRHAMVTPTQIDSFGQTNISCIGDHSNPKVQLLGVRGFPGNFISHRNSIFNENWPIFDNQKLILSTISLPIQVNGKLRGKIEVDTSLTKDKIFELAKVHKNVVSYIQDKTLLKEIYVPGKIINFVVK